MRSCCATRTAPHTDAAMLHDIAELAAAVAPSRERRMETLDQGTAFIAAAAAWHPPQLPPRVCLPRRSRRASRQPRHRRKTPPPPPIFKSFAANLISAAVRLVPLGQTAGLRVLAALEPTILRHRGNDPHRHARRSRRLRLPLRPRRHAPRNPIHEAVPLMTASTNGPLRVGIGGPVGTGKTALMDALCKHLRNTLRHRRHHQ